MSAIRDHTISRFHPIAQKQKTDLNIPPGLVSGGHVTAKTKAARKSGCQIDPWQAGSREGGREAVAGRHPPTQPPPLVLVSLQHCQYSDITLKLTICII